MSRLADNTTPHRQGVRFAERIQDVAFPLWKRQVSAMLAFLRKKSTKPAKFETRRPIPA
jgi:hypothetical protein